MSEWPDKRSVSSVELKDEVVKAAVEDDDASDSERRCSLFLNQ